MWGFSLTLNVFPSPPFSTFEQWTISVISVKLYMNIMTVKATQML
jgi:hypothetical protein